MRTNSKGQKLYPFNAIKNLHNIQKCCRHEEDKLFRYCMGELDMTDEEAQHTEDLIKFFDDVSFSGRIIYVTGPQIGFLKECCAWAESDRDSKAAMARNRG